jgi:hypothetical protein
VSSPEIVTARSENPAIIPGSMPSLFRFLFVVAVLAVILGAATVYLANFVHPNTREMSIRISPSKLGQ